MKFNSLTTIRSKLLVILLLFVLVTVAVSGIVFNYYEKNKDALTKITEKAEDAHILLLKDIKITHEFFENETINPAFFKSGKSKLITEHKQICAETEQRLTTLYAAQQKSDFNLNDSIEQIMKTFEQYQVLTASVFKQILVRGFKDYGIEGRMRNYAHDLERYNNEIGLVQVLQLRRHEKDFIIRQEETYVNKHANLINEIKDNLSVDNSIDPKKKTVIIKNLNNYSAEFTRLVAYDKKLGLKNGEGLKEQIDDISNKMESSFAAMVQFSKQKEEAALTNIKIIYLIIAFIFILSGIICALVISKRVSQSITDLKEKIDEFVKSDFTVRTVLPINHSSDEMDVLTTNFSIMEQHIVNQMNSLKQSNQDLETLFYVTSRDVRAPLIEVRELTNEASLKMEDSKMKEYLFNINQAWEKLLNIVDELGIVTNVRSSAIRAELINLDELIQSVISEFKSLMFFDNIVFTREIKMKNKFFSSPGLVKAIFRNLIENSVKYATKRQGYSFLKLSISEENEEMLKIKVSDNGIGIKKEHQDRIFDMFFRGTSHTSGTGLGLYIVKCSLEKLNGAISVESDENVGTTFTILLPNNYGEKNIKETIIHHRKILKLKNESVLNETN